ncbi:hypothetical protein [Aliiruegeria lutimaris]|uniref:Uncharacterized protein n=1 Tax=Aliiruegeria lutimaris TaxID=571298 RepID=A0A1G9K6F9_9RHOB|nr:hypothetical protein [Aliiruegeria lutimaris]SDL45470.1 hypothetical protein SAMN04488026_108617 [Aliiruegeria lutimaris]
MREIFALIRDLAAIFGIVGPVHSRVTQQTRSKSGFASQMAAFERVPHLSVANTCLRLISVLGDLKYDRADLDKAAGPIRCPVGRSRGLLLVTPTQAASQLFCHDPIEDALKRLKIMVVRHPINFYRIADTLERNERHQAFRRANGHLRPVQRQAVEAEPLRGRRVLR